MRRNPRFQRSAKGTRNAGTAQMVMKEIELFRAAFEISDKNGFPVLQASETIDTESAVTTSICQSKQAQIGLSSIPIGIRAPRR